MATAAQATQATQATQTTAETETETTPTTTLQCLKSNEMRKLLESRLQMGCRSEANANGTGKAKSIGNAIDTPREIGMPSS